MATEATFTAESDEFPLGTVFDQLPGVTVELERVVPGPEVVIPYFWVRGVHSDDIEAAFAAHPGVKNLRLVDSINDEYLMRVEWDPEHEGILSTLAETQVPLIEAVGTDREWTFKIRGDDRSDIAIFQRLCLERDIPITITALHALTPLETGAESALTEAQYEAQVLVVDYSMTPLP